MFLSICLSIRSLVHSSVCRSAYLSFCVSLCPFDFLFVRLSDRFPVVPSIRSAVHPFVCKFLYSCLSLPACLSVCLSVSLLCYLCLTICLPVCLSVFLYAFLAIYVLLSACLFIRLIFFFSLYPCPFNITDVFIFHLQL